MVNSNKNLVLIGMPGCGKTCIGKLLSEKLNLEFIDLDNYIENNYHQTITELFKSGEEKFRTLETKAVLELSKTKSTVISTGGGVIKNIINIEALRQNGLIIFIDRPISKIAKDVDLKTRPLLKDAIQNLYNLYDQRFKLYQNSADIVLKNDGNINDFLEKVINIYNSI